MKFIRWNLFENSTALLVNCLLSARKSMFLKWSMSTTRQTTARPSKMLVSTPLSRPPMTERWIFGINSTVRECLRTLPRHSGILGSHGNVLIVPHAKWRWTLAQRVVFLRMAATGQLTTIAYHWVIKLARGRREFTLWYWMWKIKESTIKKAECNHCDWLGRSWWRGKRGFWDGYLIPW